MGTRAQFFIGNPQDLENRKWLGCVAWDGYPDSDVGEAFQGVDTESKFASAVEGLKNVREDFTDPEKHGFPFPWDDDLFLTDYTYAFFDDHLQMTSFHTGWVDFAAYQNAENIREEYNDRYNKSLPDALPKDVPAPSKWDRTGKDSIMIFKAV